MRKITKSKLNAFAQFLKEEEKSQSTQWQYTYAVSAFADWLSGKAIQRSDSMKYKLQLLNKYSVASVNAAISALNSFFSYMQWDDLRVKNIKIQKQIFASAAKHLTKAEYEQLIYAAAKCGNERLCLLLQTICSTGIRVSEVSYITKESVLKGYAKINCKGKYRVVLLPRELCRILKSYMEKQKIKSGPIFVTRNGNPVNRSNIWHDMKRLCRLAGVDESKAFPHNLRHLFARTYYSVTKDIVRLADVLGHSGINTARIYTMECGETHLAQIQKLNLLPKLTNDEAKDKKRDKKRDKKSTT